MSLSVTCPDCDKSLKLKDELAGRKIRCPDCSAVISVPSADSDDDPFQDDLAEDLPPRRKGRGAVESDDDDMPTSRSRSRKPDKNRGSRPKSGGSNRILIAGGALVGLLFIAILAAAVNQALNVNVAWTTFKHPLGLAQVDMPGQPKFNAAQSQNGVQTYTLALRNYQVSLTALPFDANIQTAIATVPGTIDLMFGEMERKTPQQMPGAQLIASRKFAVGPYRALELKMNIQGHINLMRFYITPAALIGAEFVTRYESSYTTEREKFFSSIRGADGNLIEGAGQPAPGAPAMAPGNAGSPESAPGIKPTPPLNLPRPPDASPTLNGNNLSEEDPDVLRAAAHQAANAENNFAKAAQLQFWFVKKQNDGQYNLACYLSRSGQSDAALYWLQVAALEEGVDGGWATQDPDLQPLRSDPRWGQVLPFLMKCNAYWSTSSQTDTQLIMPAGVGPTDPIPVIIGLHGMGSSASGFVDEDSYQDIADEKRVAFLGVSGTIPRGPRSFVWSEDPIKDSARIDAALNEVKDRMTPKEGQLVLFGFLQGAMMSAEIAVRFPDRYAGALVMSPGGTSEPQASGFQARPNGRKQNAICICGAGEHPGNVQMTQTYANLFRQAGARVDHKPYPNLNTHSLPPDYQEKLPGWIDFLLGSTATAAKAPARTAPVKKPTAPMPPATTPVATAGSTTPAAPATDQVDKPVNQSPAEAMKSLRLKMLTTPASKLGIKSTAEFSKVYGVVMDWPTKDATVSIVSLSDGNASLYTDKSVGVIGGGAHPSVREAAIRCLRVAQSFHDDANPVSNFPIPSKGKVRFYLVGFSGVRMLEASAASLENGGGNHQDLWKECQAVMTELRKVSEKSEETK